MSTPVSPLGREIASHVLDHMTPKDLIRLAMEKSYTNVLASASTRDMRLRSISSCIDEIKRLTDESMRYTFTCNRLVRDSVMIPIAVDDMKHGKDYILIASIDGNQNRMKWTHGQVNSYTFAEDGDGIHTFVAYDERTRQFLYQKSTSTPQEPSRSPPSLWKSFAGGCATHDAPRQMFEHPICSPARR